jgi:hypothetical protein
LLAMAEVSLSLATAIHSAARACGRSERASSFAA